MSLSKLENSRIEKRVIDDEALGLLVEPGRVVEPRALATSQGAAVSGYFSDRSAMIKAAARLSGKAEGVYFTHRFAQADLAAFERLRIPPELLTGAHVRRVTDSEAREQYGITGPLTKGMSGIVFPYFSIVTGAVLRHGCAATTPKSRMARKRTSTSPPMATANTSISRPAPPPNCKMHDTLLVLVEAEKSALRSPPGRSAQA